jgi:hypothetical protein
MITNQSSQPHDARAAHSLVPDSLSSEAQTLLREAVQDAKGTLFRVRSLEGLVIRSNGQQFVEKNNPRASAIWESAVEELEAARLIADKGYQRELFRVTTQGYQVGDRLNQPKAQGEPNQKIFEEITEEPPEEEMYRDPLDEISDEPTQR